MYSLVTYASQSYMPVMRASLKNWLSSDAEKIYIYTDKSPDQKIEKRGNVTIDFRFEPTEDFGTNCARKALAMQHFMQNNPYAELVFLDADCRIVGKVANMFGSCFDVGVTIYPEVKPKYQLNNVSAGAFFIKNNAESMEFVSEWIKEQDQTTGPCRDQASLSKVLRRLDAACDVGISMFDCEIHNHHPRTGNPGEIKEFIDIIKKYGQFINILHFAHGTWKDDNILDAVETALGRSVRG